MYIHKEGIPSIIIATTVLLIGISAISLLLPVYTTTFWSLIAMFLFLWFFIVQFFKYSKKALRGKENKIPAPAEGKVVVIEEVEENLYFHEKRIQVSIFMSIWDPHLNRIPTSGKIIYDYYKPGKHFIARYPKASDWNESNTIVIERKDKVKILVKQIAGIMARRIVTYVNNGDEVKQGDQLGFIKFGSRVDLLLPRDATIHVNLGQKVKCGQTIIAEL